MVLDIFALVVIAVLIAAVILLVVKLAPLPGKIAKDRGHPQADASRRSVELSLDQYAAGLDSMWAAGIGVQ